MKKFLCMCLLPFALVLFFASFATADDAPDGELSAPPPLEVKGAPDLVVVPSERYPNQYVYMVPNMEGVYVNQGIWYRQYNGFWFSSPMYNGVWTPVGVAIMPPVIMSVPVEYALYLPPDYHRIHYGEYHNHWRSWESGRHWDHERWYQNERRSGVREARMRSIEHHREEVRHNAVRNGEHRNTANERGNRDVKSGKEIKGAKDTRDTKSVKDTRTAKDVKGTQGDKGGNGVKNEKNVNPGVKQDQNLNKPGDNKPGVKPNQNVAGIQNPKNDPKANNKPGVKPNQKPADQQVKKGNQPGKAGGQPQKQQAQRQQPQKQQAQKQQPQKQQAQKQQPQKQANNKDQKK